MVQGSNDLVPPLNPPNPPTNAEAARRHRQALPFQPAGPVPFEQAADTVQLSPNAVQAAAIAKAGGVQPPGLQRELVQQAPVPQPLGPPPARPLAPVAGTAPTAFSEKAPPVQILASASAATPAKTVLRTEPEVRPGRVQAALQTLSATTANSGAVNAQLAEKLLTEF